MLKAFFVVHAGPNAVSSIAATERQAAVSNSSIRCHPCRTITLKTQLTAAICCLRVAGANMAPAKKASIAP